MFRKTQYSKKELQFFFFAPVILMFALEFVRFPSILDVWMEFRNFWFPVKWALTYLFILSWEGFFLAVTGSTFAANTVVSAVLCVLGIVSHLISLVVGDPLLPTHVFLVANTGSIASFGRLPFSVGVFITLGILVTSSVYQWKLCYRKKEKNPEKKRRIPLAVALVLIGVLASYLLCFNYTFRYKVLAAVDIEVRAFEPLDDLKCSGLVMTFFPRIGNMRVPKPEGYSEEVIDDICKQYANYTVHMATPEKTPNIIVIQSEAFWDPTMLSGVSFSEDPMPFIRSLRSAGRGGSVVSPVFGGDTCLPEFEFLTGFSTTLMPPNTYPYIQYVTRETPSFVSILRDNGYETVAMHMYQKNFYSRDTAYPLLGFDEFIGEDDLEEPEIVGPYISDMEMTRQIISAYENREKDNFFMFNVSMQNHWEFNPDRYETYDIQIDCEGLSEEDLEGLHGYVEGIHMTDDALRVLTEYFAEQEEETIIIFYGDHLPRLGGNEYSTYQTGGFLPISEEKLDFSTTPVMFETPYVVWSNYNTGITDWPDRLSPAKLGLLTFKLSGVTEYPWYVKVIDDFYSKYDVYQRYISYDSNGFWVKEMPEGAEKNYQWIQYDVLNGKQYYLEEKNQ